MRNKNAFTNTCTYVHPRHTALIIVLRIFSQLFFTLLSKMGINYLSIKHIKKFFAAKNIRKNEMPPTITINELDSLGVLR